MGHIKLYEVNLAMRGMRRTIFKKIRGKIEYY